MSLAWICYVRCDAPGCEERRELGDKSLAWTSRKDRSWCPAHAHLAPVRRVRKAKETEGSVRDQKETEAAA